MTDRLIRITTTLAVLMVASVAAVIPYQHARELVDIDESQEAGAVRPGLLASSVS